MKKNYAVAIILNIVLPGTGHMYAGQVVIGAIALILGIGSAVGFGLGIEQLSGVCAFFNFATAFHVYFVVKRHNEALDVIHLERCPQCAEPIKAGAGFCANCHQSID